MKSKIQLTIISMTALCALSLGLLFNGCSKSSSSAPPPDKTSLQLAIDSASLYSTTTTEGTKPGDYTTGSKTALNTALAAANAVLADPKSDQATLTNAAANLQAAITTYKGAFIKEIAAANLIAYWKMNGNANDSSGNAHNGTVTIGHVFFGAGTPTLTNDRFGNANKAYHFDHGGNIEVPYSTALNPQQLSISLWAREDTIGRTVNPANNYMVAMNRWNGFKFQTQSGYLPFFTVRAFEAANNPTDTTIYDHDDAGTALKPGATWYHLVVTFKPGEEDFYIDGSLVTTWPTALGAGKVPGTPISLSPSPVNLTIGSDLPTSRYLTVDASGNFLVDYGGFWTGDLDDVMFYNIALTGPQVLSIFTNQNTQ
jgi:hypothetical protein